MPSYTTTLQEVLSTNELPTSDFTDKELNETIRNVGSSVSTSNTDNQLTQVSVTTYFNYLSSIVASVGNIVSDVANSVVNIYLAGTNIYSAFANLTQYEKFGNALVSAGSNYVNEKLERLKSLYTTKVPVTVGTIIGEIAPYAMDIGSLGKDIEDKISKILGFITGTNVGVDENGKSTLKEVLKAVGIDALDSLEDNDDLKKAFNSLNIVKATAQGITTYKQVKDAIKKVKAILESGNPIMAMMTNLADIRPTKGVSAIEMGSTASVEAQKAAANIKALALYALKKLIFPIRIPLPAILVGAVDSISVRSAMLDLPDNLSWISALFNDDFFNNIGYTAMWADSISTAVNAIQGAIYSIQNATQNWSQYTYTNSEGEVIVTSTGKAISKGDYMTSLFMESMTKTYMQAAVESARKTAYLPDYSKITWITKSSSEKYTTDITSSINNTSSLTIDQIIRTNNSYELQNENTESQYGLTENNPSIGTIVRDNSTQNSITTSALNKILDYSLVKNSIIQNSSLILNNSSLNKLLEDNSEQSPIDSIDSIITISKLVYDNIV